MSKQTGYEPTPLTYEQLDILHALRGFCALYVVAYHAKYLLWSGATRYLQAFPVAGWGWGQYLGFAADVANSAGYEMVIVFFVLSGFFIRYASQKKPRTAGQFYLNRLVRIYPPYLCSMLLAATVLYGLATYRPDLLAPTTLHEQNAGLLKAWQELCQSPAAAVAQATLFLRPGPEYFGYNSAYWSLLPEALFYLLVPLAFRWVRLYYVLSGLLFLGGVLATIGHANLSLLADFFLLYNGYFALGSGLYDVVVARPAILQRCRQASALVVWPVLGLLLAAVVVLAALHRHQEGAPVAAVLAVAAIVVLLSGRVSRQQPIIRGLHEVGVFSFSLYLYHFPLLLVSYAALTAATGSLVSYGRWYWLFVPVVVLGCYLLYLITERLAVRRFRRV